METGFSLDDFSYELPAERIAQYPAEPRDSSKLLLHQGGQISHHSFTDLPRLLPQGALLVFNDTKVLPARLFPQLPSGRSIELFLLKPVGDQGFEQALASTGTSTWEAMVGGRRLWKEGVVASLKHEDLHLQLSWHQREAQQVCLRWEPASHTMAHVLQALGSMPLPPYLNRAAEAEDHQRYQTIFAKAQGAVAAPTASLHFSARVMDALQQAGVQHATITLHVGAGTFLPVKVDDVRLHTMHSEQVELSLEALQKLAHHADPIIPVGTTALRTLESVYWHGCKLAYSPAAPFCLLQQEPYELQALPPQQALQLVLKQAAAQGGSLRGETSLYIRPGYTWRLAQGIVTNFHQPRSSLIILVSTLVGSAWRRIYSQAMQNDYRFLSFGDSSLLLP